MADTYPYMISNGKIPDILIKIKSAGKPEKFTYEFFKKLGFVSSNDRAAIPLLKRLGFLNEDGTPTEYYSRLKDSSDQPFVLGERIRDLYSDVYVINSDLHNVSDEEMEGAFSRVTGKDTSTVKRYVSTYKALAALAKFGQSPSVKDEAPPMEQQPSMGKEPIKLDSDFHYNIQIHLPTTTDVGVYNAIFKSIKENLM